MFSRVPLSLDLCARTCAQLRGNSKHRLLWHTSHTTGDRCGWRLLPWQMDGLCKPINVWLKPTERPVLDSKEGDSRRISMLCSTVSNAADISIINERSVSRPEWMCLSMLDSHIHVACISSCVNVCFHAGCPQCLCASMLDSHNAWKSSCVNMCFHAGLPRSLYIILCECVFP